MRQWMWMIVLAGACHDPAPCNSDSSAVEDLAAPPDDLTVSADLAMPPDLRKPDLSVPICVDNTSFLPGGGPNPDMAMSTPDAGGDVDGGAVSLDMSAPRAIACGHIYDCLGKGLSAAACAAFSPPAARKKWDDLLFCWQSVCNLTAVSSCDNCLNNTIADSPTMTTFFVDGMGMPLQCLADGTVPTGGKPAGDCGSCLDKAYACVFECYSDADCALLTHSDGSPATCDTTGQCV